MKVTVKAAFYDLQDETWRPVGDEFEAKKERVEEIKEFVEVDAKK